MLSNEHIDRELFEAMKPENVSEALRQFWKRDGSGSSVPWSPCHLPADAVQCAEWFWKRYDQRPVCYIDDGDQWRTSIESTEDGSELYNVRAKSFPESLARAIHAAITKGSSND